jgi:predicted SnoaL-like aldol condensation-catalyzing enzyme
VSLKKAMEENHLKFPSQTFQVEHAIGENNIVAVHGSLQLEIEDPVMIVVHIMRFENDLIVEMWDISQNVPEKTPNENGVF